MDVITTDSDGQHLLFPAPGFGRRKEPPASPPAPSHSDADAGQQGTKKPVSKLTGRRAKIVAFLREQGHHGATRDEISVAFDLPVHCLTAAVKQLLDSGDIEETNRTRNTRLGCPAAVLVIPNDRRNA